MTNTLAEARSREQAALVFFTASWCGPCQMMVRTTLTNEAVAKVIGSISHVALDVDEHRDLAQEYAVSAIPTFKLLTPAGDEVLTTTGFQDAPDFRDWLTNGIAQVRATVGRPRRRLWPR